MSHSELRARLTQLAGLYQLRHDEAKDRFLGIHRGVAIDASEADGVVTLVFGSPTADLRDEITEGFGGFRHCAEAGLEITWFTSSQQRDADGNVSTSPHRCVLEINDSSFE